VQCCGVALANSISTAHGHHLQRRQVPEIFDYLLKVNQGKFKAIAKHQLKKVFQADEATKRQQAKT
jgi:hypothetical protein